MTLRLVSNVTELEVENVKDLAAQARLFADKLEAGDFGDVSRFLVVIDGAPLRFQYSGNAANSYELMGLLEAAKMVIFTNDDE